MPYSFIKYWSVSNQWFVNNYAICNEFYDTSLSYRLWSSDNCSVQTLTSDSKNVIVSFLKTVKQWDYFYVHLWTWSNSIVSQFCISSQEYWKSLCFWNCRVSNSSLYSCSALPWLITPLWNTHHWLWYWSWFDEVDSDLMWPSPAVSTNFDSTWDVSFNTWWNDIIINPEIDDYIEYYEDRWNWNKNMCYVWTTDFVSSYDTWQVDFYPWTWDTIFWLYYYFYNTFWDNIIHNVWTFLNVWLINYTQWFDTLDEDKLYLATYNWPDTNISLYYTWFSNPFSWKPAVIWYMSHNLFNYYSTESTQWEEMAYYCYMKLNYDNLNNWTLDFDKIKDSVTPWINKRITDYVNNHLWNWNSSYSSPDTLSWSIWDWLVQTWYLIPQDLSPIKLFKDYYDKINWLVRWFNAVNSKWLLPWWIIYPMVFLVLFRIFKH